MVINHNTDDLDDLDGATAPTTTPPCIRHWSNQQIQQCFKLKISQDTML